MSTQVRYVVEYACTPYPNDDRELDWRPQGEYRREPDALKAMEREVSADFLGHHYRVSVKVTTSWVINGPVKVDHG